MNHAGTGLWLLMTCYVCDLQPGDLKSREQQLASYSQKNSSNRKWGWRDNLGEKTKECLYLLREEENKCHITGTVDAMTLLLIRKHCPVCVRCHSSAWCMQLLLSESWHRHSIPSLNPKTWLHQPKFPSLKEVPWKLPNSITSHR